MTTLREYIEERKAPIVSARGCLLLLLMFPSLIGPFLLSDQLESWGVPNEPLLFFLLAIPLIGAFLWLLDMLLWSRLLRCPKCNATLWGSITHNIKARRIHIRTDAYACPGCGLAMDEVCDEYVYPNPEKRGDDFDADGVRQLLLQRKLSIVPLGIAFLSIFLGVAAANHYEVGWLMPAGIAAFALFFALHTYLQSRIMRMKCPACGKPFHSSRRFVPVNTSRKNCVNCGFRPDDHKDTSKRKSD
jgi:hypothetical protein